MSTTATIAPPARSFGLPIATFGALVMMASAGAPSPFYPILQQQIGFSSAIMALIFAVYAVALLCVLLIAGSISDHVGRRPVISVGFVMLALSLWCFTQATDISGLIAARVLQGMACALLISTLSATIADLEPKSRPGIAAVINTVVPLLGLGTGALIAGLFLDYSRAPEFWVFDGLILLSLILALAAWLLPETSPRHEGLLQALRPRVGVPPEVSRVFWACAPAMFAGWATGGLYLSLGAPMMSHIFGIEANTPHGLIVTLLAGMGALACFVARNAKGPGVLLYGTAALSLGTLVCLIAAWSGNLTLYLIALTVAGTGFGTCFFGALRNVMPLAPADGRAELFASIFTLCYLAFGIPAVIAGLMVPIFGLLITLTGYGALVILGAATAGVLRWRQLRG
ncbi:major facilitator transporter [Thioclava dalianensis]|uniref:Major facilitator transporter n=1 Tax=Thioclava dalianensis TaxID=1185766 RepID=A0A074U7Y8_9RHOB|nr:MFS transporter [Thioclava dalianensis]KEP70772.1 major facilitator transporter [Thioclava dalianensis]SFN10376.1 Predicted arabinose efflux permease, MFS family [Thioclava dalianensis]